MKRNAAMILAALMLALSASPAFAHHGHTGNHYGVSQGQGFHGKHLGAGKHSPSSP
jgi:hydrogenase/urease accessory protein HupE